MFITTRKSWLQSFSSVCLSFAFLLTSILPPAYAQVLNLPQVGTMVGLSSTYTPAIVAGITVYPEDPFQLDFLVDVGDDRLQGDALKQESQKLIRYFMAALTIPEDDMWVNLSPYEKDRIIADGLGDTALGRDMLAQDYILKQLTASLMHPEDKLGNKFWQRIYKKAQEKFGTTEIPTNTFNKIWIVPEKAVIYSKGTNVFIADSHLKVMIEEDYLALEHYDQGLKPSEDSGMTDEAKRIIKELFLPEIEKEINEGKNFAPLRQIYHSIILATWYKKNIKESLLSKVYANQNKVDGVDVIDKDIKNKIYNQYLEAFEKGVYDFIKEDVDPTTEEVVIRKYFSGGAALNQVSGVLSNTITDFGSWIKDRAGSSTIVRAGTQLNVLTNVSVASSPSDGKSLEEQLKLFKVYHPDSAQKIFIKGWREKTISYLQARGGIKNGFFTVNEDGSVEVSSKSDDKKVEQPLGDSLQIIPSNYSNQAEFELALFKKNNPEQSQSILVDGLGTKSIPYLDVERGITSGLFKVAQDGSVSLITMDEIDKKGGFIKLSSKMEFNTRTVVLGAWNAKFGEVKTGLSGNGNLNIPAKSVPKANSLAAQYSRFLEESTSGVANFDVSPVDNPWSIGQGTVKIERRRGRLVAKIGGFFRKLEFLLYGGVVSPSTPKDQEFEKINRHWMFYSAAFFAVLSNFDHHWDFSFYLENETFIEKNILKIEEQFSPKVLLESIRTVDRYTHSSRKNTSHEKKDGDGKSVSEGGKFKWEAIKKEEFAQAAAHSINDRFSMGGGLAGGETPVVALVLSGGEYITGKALVSDFFDQMLPGGNFQNTGLYLNEVDLDESAEPVHMQMPVPVLKKDQEFSLLVTSDRLPATVEALSGQFEKVSANTYRAIEDIETSFLIKYNLFPLAENASISFRGANSKETDYLKREFEVLETDPRLKNVKSQLTKNSSQPSDVLNNIRDVVKDNMFATTLYTTIIGTNDTFFDYMSQELGNEEVVHAQCAIGSALSYLMARHEGLSAVLATGYVYKPEETDFIESEVGHALNFVEVQKGEWVAFDSTRYMQNEETDVKREETLVEVKPENEIYKTVGGDSLSKIVAKVFGYALGTKANSEKIFEIYELNKDNNGVGTLPKDLKGPHRLDAGIDLILPPRTQLLGNSGDGAGSSTIEVKKNEADGEMVVGNLTDALINFEKENKVNDKMTFEYDPNEKIYVKHKSLVNFGFNYNLSDFLKEILKDLQENALDHHVVNGSSQKPTIQLLQKDKQSIILITNEGAPDFKSLRLEALEQEIYIDDSEFVTLRGLAYKHFPNEYTSKDLRNYIDPSDRVSNWEEFIEDYTELSRDRIKSLSKEDLLFMKGLSNKKDKSKFHGGMGTGLSDIKKLVEQTLGGEFKFETQKINEEDYNTVFSIILETDSASSGVQLDMDWKDEELVVTNNLTNAFKHFKKKYAWTGVEFSDEANSIVIIKHKAILGGEDFYKFFSDLLQDLLKNAIYQNERAEFSKSPDIELFQKDNQSIITVTNEGKPNFKDLKKKALGMDIYRIDSDLMTPTAYAHMLFPDDYSREDYRESVDPNERMPFWNEFIKIYNKLSIEETKGLSNEELLFVVGLSDKEGNGNSLAGYGFGLFQAKEGIEETLGGKLKFEIKEIDGEDHTVFSVIFEAATASSSVGVRAENDYLADIIVVANLTRVFERFRKEAIGPRVEYRYDKSSSLIIKHRPIRDFFYSVFYKVVGELLKNGIDQNRKVGTFNKTIIELFKKEDQSIITVTNEGKPNFPELRSKALDMDIYDINSNLMTPKAYARMFFSGSIHS